MSTWELWGEYIGTLFHKILAAHCTFQSIFTGIKCLVMVARDGIILNNNFAEASIFSFLFFISFDKCYMVKLKKPRFLINPIVVDYGSAGFGEMTFMIPLPNNMKSFKLQIQTMTFEQCSISLIMCLNVSKIILMVNLWKTLSK